MSALLAGTAAVNSNDLRRLRFPSALKALLSFCKGKCKFLYEAVSISRDYSKRFTIFYLAAFFN